MAPRPHSSSVSFRSSYRHPVRGPNGASETWACEPPLSCGQMGEVSLGGIVDFLFRICSAMMVLLSTGATEWDTTPLDPPAPKAGLGGPARPSQRKMPEITSEECEGLNYRSATLWDSQSSRSAAICILFFSIITMWPLP